MFRNCLLLKNFVTHLAKKLHNGKEPCENIEDLEKRIAETIENLVKVDPYYCRKQFHNLGKRIRLVANQCVIRVF